MSITKIIKMEEGLKLVPYLCSEDYVTIGFGTKLHKSKGMNPKDFPVVITEQIAELWMLEDISKIVDRLYGSSQGEVFARTGKDRQWIIISMCYQMGVTGVLQFHNMWNALAMDNYAKASVEMLDSKWADQTPARAHRHAQVMQTGSIKGVY